MKNNFHNLQFKPSVLTIALVGVFTVCVNFSNAANAQEPTSKQTRIQTEGNDLPVVVVTASRLPQTLSDTIANTTVINRTDIERSGAVDLPSLLLTQAGIEFGRNGGVGQLASIFMRGTSARNTLVLIDGIPVNNQNDGAANLTLLPLDLIERIEIVRGNVSAAYGSNATGGVIQLFTRTPTAALSGAVSVEAGTQNQRKLGANLSFGTADTRVIVHAARTLNQGVSAQRVDQSPFANPDNDGSAQTTGGLTVIHRASSNVNLGLRALSTAQNNQYDSSQTRDDRTNLRINQVSAFADWRVIPNWLIQTKVSEQIERGSNTSNGVYSSVAENHRQMVSVQNTFELGAWGSALLGLEHENLRFAGQSFGTYGSTTPSATRNVDALLAGWQGKFNSIGWNINLRNDNSAGENVNTYAVGASYEFTPAWSVHASQATAFNRPTLGQMNDPNYGNSALKAERARNQEVGVQWQNGTSLVRLTGFRAKTRDQFGFNPVTYQTINIDRVSNQGAELIAETSMPWTGGKLRGSFNSQNPIDDTTGLILARRSKQQIRTTFAGNMGAWTWDATLGYVDNRADKNYNTYPAKAVTLASYVKVDTNVSYAITNNTSVSLAVANLTNVNDQTAYGYSGTPRGAVLRFKYKL